MNKSIFWVSFKKVNLCIKKNKRWTLAVKTLDDGKDKNWYRMILLGVRFHRPHSHAYKRKHTLSINILMSTHKFTQTLIP